MDFNSGLPQIDAIQHNQAHQMGLSSAVTDPVSGELLCYMGSWRIWNHENGPGSYISRHAISDTNVKKGLVMLPTVCPRRYFVFVADDKHYRHWQRHAFGMYYGIYDLDKDDGRGGYMALYKGKGLYKDSTMESLTAIHSFKQRSYWLVGHSLHGDDFLAFEVTGNSVSEVVTSSVGYDFISPAEGMLKLSPDGNNLAMAAINANKVELYQFDNSTGIVSDPIDEINKRAHAVAFSPGSQRLYTTEFVKDGDKGVLRVWQYDINSLDLQASGKELIKVEYDASDPVWEYEYPGLANLALGPDDALYITEPVRSNVFRINNPDAAAADIQITSLATPAGTHCGDSFVSQYYGGRVFYKAGLKLEVNAQLSGRLNICRGDTAELNTQNNSPGKFEWRPKEGLSHPDSSSTKATPQQTTTYYFRYESECDFAYDSVTVKVSDRPGLRVSSPAALCGQGSVQLTAEGAERYVWDPREGLDTWNGPTPIASPDKTTTYTVYGQVGLNCLDSAKVEVVVLEQPEFDLGPDLTVCAGDRVQLTAAGGSEYRWWPDEEISDVNSPTPWITPTQDRMYYVEVTNAGGCARIDSIMVQIGAEVQLPQGLTYTICRGSEVHLQLNGPEGKYSWSPVDGLDDPNVKQPLASPAKTTIYTVRLESSCGVAEAQFEVRVIEKPSANLQPITICAGQSVELNPEGDDAFEYRWDDHPDIPDRSAKSPRVQPAQSTNYYVTIGSGDCTVRGSLRVEVLESAELMVGPDVQICAGSSTLLTVDGADEYLWSPAEGLSDARSATPTAAPQRTTMYYVRGKIGDACEALDSVLVEIIPGDRVLPDPLEPRVCSGESVQLNLTSDVLLESVRWSPATGLNNPNIVNPMATLSATQEFTVEYTTVEGCSGSLAVRVLVGDVPQLTVDRELVQVCVGGDSEIGAQVTAAGAESYEWFDASGTLVNNTAVWDIPASQPEGAYRLVGRDAAGCSSELWINIEHLPAPTAQAHDSYHICAGESVRLSASGGTRYVWSPGTGLDDPSSATPLATPQAGIDYSVRVFNELGCSDRAGVRVDVDPRARVHLSAPNVDGPLLPGDEVELLLAVELFGDAGDFNRQAFELELAYPPAALSLLRFEPLNTNELAGWELRAEETLVAGSIILSGRSTGAPLPRSFVLSLRMRLLVFNSAEPVVQAAIIAADLGGFVNCDVIKSDVAVQLEELCVLSSWDIVYAGTQFGLMQNAPNPVDAQTQIVYSLGFDTEVVLLLTDQLGRVLRTLVQERQSAGVYTVDVSTAELSRGQYRYTLRAGPFNASRLLIVQ